MRILKHLVLASLNSGLMLGSGSLVMPTEAFGLGDNRQPEDIHKPVTVHEQKFRRHPAATVLCKTRAIAKRVRLWGKESFARKSGGRTQVIVSPSMIKEGAGCPVMISRTGIETQFAISFRGNNRIAFAASVLAILKSSDRSPDL